MVLESYGDRATLWSLASRQQQTRADKSRQEQTRADRADKSRQKQTTVAVTGDPPPSGLD
jgi:ribosomal protein L4